MTAHVVHRARLHPSGTRSPARPAVAVSGSPQRYKRNLLPYLWHGNLLTLLIAPVIYSLIVPLVLLDGWATVYQWICFPALGIARVRHREHFVIDRHALPYLNVLEKVNCTFCSYANGVLGFVGEVQARTEQYWCPIKHADRVPHPHRRYARFFAYDDPRSFRDGLPALRRQLRED